MAYKYDNYLIHYDEDYYHDTVDGYKFYTDIFFAIHPCFLESAENLGHPIRTVGDFLDWWDSNQETISKTSDPSIYVTQVLSFIGAQGESSFEFTSGRVNRNTKLLEIMHSGEDNTSFILLENNGQDDLIEVVFDYSSRNTAPFRLWTYPADVPTQETDAYPSWLYKVMNYTFNPASSDYGLPFLSSKKDFNPLLYFGLELEVSTLLSAKELQTIVTTIEPIQEPFFFMKSDASISGSYPNLYEIVTFPMTPRRQRIEWRIFFDKLQRLCSEKDRVLEDVFDTSTDLNNGIHIHLSKSAFVETLRGHKGHMNRFVTAWNLWDSRSQKFYKKISKRQVEPRSSVFYRVHSDLDGKTLARRLSRGVTMNREIHHRSCCHVTRQTVELRVFQGWFNLKHILGCIELTEATFEFTRECPLSKMNFMYSEKFKSWLLNRHGWKHAKEIVKCA